MNATPGPRAVPTPAYPWFRRRPGLALALAGVMYAAIFLLRLLDGTPLDPYSMLFALPVALVATTYGLRAGVLGGALAFGLTALWAVTQHISLSPTDWVSRAVPLMLLGVLVGHATDRERGAEVERRRLEASALLQREAIEINDSLVQSMAAARWAFDIGEVDSGNKILDQTIVRGQDLVSGLIRQADMGSHSEPLNARTRSA